MKLLPYLALIFSLGLNAAEPPSTTGLERSASPPGASVAFAELRNGDAVSPTFTVEFVVSGMDVVPAGTEAASAGHHHLLIDVEQMPPLNLPLPKTDNIRHFGGGETIAEVTLPPGEHTLQLLFADYLHIPHDPPVMSEKITVIVSDEAE